MLYLDGVIAEESWFDDDMTPAAFKAELASGDGDITVWLNSPGGDCVAASQIYAMLMDYKGAFIVKVDDLAASAASVIAMADTEVLMAPTALMMVHNPLTIAIGDSEEMRRAIGMLAEVKESIINAYRIKTGQERDRLSKLMDAETWLSAHKAVELGFADGILTDSKREQAEKQTYAFSRRAVTNSLLGKVIPKAKPPEQAAGPPEPGQANGQPKEPQGVPAEPLLQRLALITH